jgi:hypothetical protein
VRGFVEQGDCYQVEPDGAGFLVRHFPNRETRQACCQLRVRITDRDRAQAIPDADPHGAAACLHRAYVAMEKRHAEAR